MNSITEYGLWAGMIVVCLLVIGFFKQRRVRNSDRALDDMLRVVQLVRPVCVTHQANGVFGEAIDRCSGIRCRFAIFQEVRGSVRIQVYAYKDGALLKESYVWLVGPVYGHT